LKTLSADDQAWLWHELAHAIRHERPPAQALGELAETNAGTARGKVALRLADSLNAGESVSQAVGRLSDSFDFGAAPAIEAGEKASRVSEVLESLAESIRAESHLRSGIAHAVLYPVLLAIAALAAILFIHFRILPWFDEIWDEFELGTSSATRLFPILCQVEAFVLLFVPALSLFILYLAPRRIMPFQQQLDSARLAFPLVGRAMGRVHLARWCRTMGMLVQAGVPEPAAVRLAGKGTGNARVAAISNDLGERLERGASLAQAMEGEWFFPPPLAWMVASAERAGGHARVWPVASDMYRTRGERLNYMISIVLRILFIMLAFQIIGVVVLTIFLPLIQLMNSLGG